MDRQILTKILADEGYPAQMLESTIAKLNHLHPEIATAFITWLSEGKIPTLSVEGYSFATLTRNYGMSPVGAFLTLDWLQREPEKASAALKRGIR